MSMVSFCIYCGMAVEHSNCSQAEAHRRLIEHDRVCPRNPILAELNEATAKNASLRAEMLRTREILEKIADELEKRKWNGKT